MNTDQKNSPVSRTVDPRAARTKDNSLGIDDIGLPEDIAPEGARKPEDIKPGRKPDEKLDNSRS